MRLSQSAVVAVLLVLAFGQTSIVEAGPGKKDDGEIAMGLALEGFADPPNANKAAGGYVNPCLDHEDFTYHVSRSTGLVKNDVGKVSVELGGEVIKVETNSPPGASIGFTVSTDEEFEIEFVEWVTACAEDESTSSAGYEAGTVNRYWVRRPTQGSIVPELLAQLYGSLDAPTAVWPNRDIEFGWIYVNIDNDIRVDPADTERFEASITNVTGTASAWVQATPSLVTFASGEPDGSLTTCTYANATAPYSLDQASACHYRYRHSSAIATGQDSAFIGRTTLHWDITSSGPLDIADGTSWRETPIQVAEVQAIVQK